MPLPYMYVNYQHFAGSACVVVYMYQYFIMRGT